MVDIFLRALEAVPNDIRLFDPLTASASGAMVGSATMTFAQSATLVGDGALAGPATIVFTPSGAVTASAALVGSATITFASTASMVGSGALAGASTLVFDGTGTLIDGTVASGAMAGQASLTLNASGELVSLTSAVVAAPTPQGGAMWFRSGDDGSVRLHARHLVLAGLVSTQPDLTVVSKVIAPALALPAMSFGKPRLTRDDLNEITDILALMDNEIWTIASRLRAA